MKKEEEWHFALVCLKKKSKQNKKLFRLIHLLFVSLVNKFFSLSFLLCNCNLSGGRGEKKITFVYEIRLNEENKNH